MNQKKKKDWPNSHINFYEKIYLMKYFFSNEKLNLAKLFIKVSI